MVLEGLPEQLPFEFRVLEIALDVVCHYLETKVWELEHKARPALDQLTKMISTSNLELVRSVKSQLTRLTARVQKVMFFKIMLTLSIFCACEEELLFLS